MHAFEGFEKIVRQGEPLAMHTWLQLGGPAEYFAEPRNTDELLVLIKRCGEQGMPMRVLGDGSNLLVRDAGVPGLVIRLSEPAFCTVEIEGRTVTAGAGAPLGRVVTGSVREGLAGLEALVATPGTVGGALRSHVGVHGSDFGRWIDEVTVVTHAGEVRCRPREELGLGYRHGNIDDPVILSARFQLEEDDPRELARRLQKLWIVRKAAQPMGHQCAVRVFRDPRGMSAGELIEQAGLKGTRIGGAVVSERYANFIIAEPECTAADVLRVIELVSNQVSQRSGVTLEPAIEIW